MEIAQLAKILEEKGVRWVRILWCDNANIIRSKAFHVKTLSQHFEHGIGISVARQAIPALVDAVVPETGLGPVGEVWLKPDWSTFNVLPYAPGHARVISDIVSDGRPWTLCPRHLLRRMIAEAKTEGLEIKAAFENEFYLVQPTPNGFTPVDETVFAATLAMDLNREVIDEIAEALISQGLQVERYYPESGPGQHEITVGYTHALQAADNQIIYRETVHAVTAPYNLKASFLPVIFSDKAGSGCHLHVSLWKDQQNVLPDPKRPGELSGISQAFIAGVLFHLPALMALTTPSPNSYRRIRPHFWSGAFRVWGWDNREAAVRVPTNPEPPSPTHFEFKTVDGSANPFLALGGVIAAGLDGVRRSLDVGAPVSEDPGRLPEKERREKGIDMLPLSLEEAIGHMEQDEILLNALGSELANVFLAVRRAEWEVLKEVELDQEVRLLLERY